MEGSAVASRQPRAARDPSNPMLEMVDLRAVSEMAHAAGAIVVVDNVFATPLLQQPLELGADVVVYSCTKHMDGQGRVLGGAVLGRKEWIEKMLQPFIRNTGPTLSAVQRLAVAQGSRDAAARLDASGRWPRPSPTSSRTRPASPRMVSDTGRSSPARAVAGSK